MLYMSRKGHDLQSQKAEPPGARQALPSSPRCLQKELPFALPPSHRPFSCYSLIGIESHVFSLTLEQ